MTKINIILFLALILVALGVITAQHKARNLKNELEQQEQLTQTYETEFGQLQLEQSTWAMHSRLEEYAQQKLHMRVPDMKRIQVINLEAVN
ncbi:MAG: cell division protein FtsL [Methylophilus sp.]|nr:cell division protein FtsL [Methylophilus sp.]